MSGPVPCQAGLRISFSWDHHLPADRHVQLRSGGQVRTNEICVIQLNGAVTALRSEKIEQRRAAMLIGKKDRVANARRLLQVFLLVWTQQNQIALHCGVAGIHIAKNRSLGSIAQSFLASDVQLCPQFFPLVAVKNTQGDTDTRAQGVYAKGIVVGGIVRVPGAESWVG